MSRAGHHDDPTEGWPTGQHSPFTPAGKAEQVDKLLYGLSRQRGWRLVAARIAAAVVLLAILGVIALEIARIAR